MTVHLGLVAVKVIVLILGFAIAALTFLAYRRTRERLLLYIGVGMGLVAFGSFVEGVLFEVLDWDLLLVHVVESAFVVAGLAMLAVWLRPRSTRREV